MLRQNVLFVPIGGFPRYWSRLEVVHGGFAGLLVGRLCTYGAGFTCLVLPDGRLLFGCQKLVYRGVGGTFVTSSNDCSVDAFDVDVVVDVFTQQGAVFLNGLIYPLPDFEPAVRVAVRVPGGPLGGVRLPVGHHSFIEVSFLGGVRFVPRVFRCFCL